MRFRGKATPRLHKTTKYLMYAHRGYRNPWYSGDYESPHTKFVQVLHYEVDELGNEDILDTCEHLYGISYEGCETNEDKMVKVLGLMMKKFGTLELECCWLGSKETVNNLYGGNEISYGEISRVACWIPTDAIVVSDLGEDGALFVSKNQFRLIE